MRANLHGGLIAALAWLAAAAPAPAASFLDWLLPKHDVQVIAVTDTTPAGLLRRPASPQNPIYYLAVSAGYRDFGGIIAGEKVPPKEQVFSAIAKVLAKQGYLPANNEHPATILMLWTWGTMNTDRFYTGNPDDLEGRQVNRNQLLRFMGGYKVGLVSKEAGAFQDSFMLPGAIFRDADSEMISDLASEDLYVAAIAAYDAAAAARKEKMLLWTTKISCPSRGLAMNETLPAMLMLAGPYIGKETVKPVSVKATDKFKPKVEIGDPTTVEFLEKNAVQVLETPAADPKKAKPPAAKQKK